MEPARLAAAEERLSRLSTQISSAESAITDKETELHQRAARLVENEACIASERARPKACGAAEA